MFTPLAASQDPTYLGYHRDLLGLTLRAAGVASVQAESGAFLSIQESREGTSELQALSESWTSRLLQHTLGTPAKHLRGLNTIQLAA